MTREQSVIVYHKNPYSLPGFESGTFGFVVWISDHQTSRPSKLSLTFFCVKPENIEVLKDLFFVVCRDWNNISDSVAIVHLQPFERRECGLFQPYSILLKTNTELNIHATRDMIKPDKPTSYPQTLFTDV
jgi:hypothetical protein